VSERIGANKVTGVKIVKATALDKMSQKGMWFEAVLIKLKGSMAK